MSTTDVPLSPDERFRLTAAERRGQVAAILASGLLRLRRRGKRRGRGQTHDAGNHDSEGSPFPPRAEPEENPRRGTSAGEEGLAVGAVPPASLSNPPLCATLNPVVSVSPKPLTFIGRGLPFGSGFGRVAEPMRSFEADLYEHQHDWHFDQNADDRG